MDETRLLLSRLDDLIYKYYCKERCSLGFLNELEVSTAHNYLNNLNVEHSFYGGYPAATRMILSLSENSDDFDGIVSLKIVPRGEFNLTHRDFLGSLMGLGISRECVGDILLKDSIAVAFVRREISEYLLQNLTSVGRASVNVSVYDNDVDELAPEHCEIEVLLTSMRIDNFISSICKCSRKKANEYIESDYVFVNYSCVKKPSKVLNTGDTISIRGFGKFKIGEILRKTKSDRIVLSVLQYK